MLIRLLAVFILVPLIELVLLLQLADATSWLTTLAIIVITGVIGTLLARRQGIAAWVRFQSALSQGRMPSVEAQEGLLIALAAVLLLSPGLLTDATGFLLLTPWGRQAVVSVLRRQWRRGRFEVRSFGQQPFEHDSFDSGRGPVSGSARNATGADRHAADEPGAVHGPGQRSGEPRKRTWTIDAPSFGPKQDFGPKQAS